MADYELEDEHCSGCGLVINEGNVITFDDNVWHVKCFRCSSCHASFQTNSNILILNEQPVCESCSYTCEVCKNHIHDQAILIGDKEVQAFHQRCFKCYSCHQPLEPNEYTSTNKGFQCSQCHSSDSLLSEEISPEISTDMESLSQDDVEFIPPIANPIETNTSPLIPGRPHIEPPTRSSSITKRPTRSHSLRTPTEQKSKFKKRQSMMPPRSHSDLGLEGIHGPPTLPPLPFVDDAILEENINQIIEGVRQTQLNSVEDPSLSSSVTDEEKSSEDNTDIGTDVIETSDIVESSPLDISSEVISLKALNRQLVEQLENVREDLLKEAKSRQDIEEKYKVLEVERDLLLQSHEEYTNQKKEAVNMYKILSDNIEHLSVQKEEMETIIHELQLQKESLYLEIDSMSKKKQIELDSLSISDEKKRESFMILSNGYQDSNYANFNNPLVVEPLSPSFNYPLEKPNDEKLRRRSAVVNQYKDTDLSQSLAISYEESEFPSMNESEYQNTTPYNNALEVPASSKADGKKESKKFKWMGGSSFKSKGKSTSAPNSNEREPEPDNTPPASNSKIKYKKSNSSSLLTNKSHTFIIHTFIRPLKCDHCGEKMWGLQNKEMRCQLCGFHSHIKCSNLAAQDCPGHIQTEKEASGGVVNMFGNELEEQLRFEGRDIPLIVELCIDAVEKRGIMLEGIYRKSGPTSQMRDIQSALARAANGEGPPPNLEDPEEFSDITAVTSVVKQYFRELPVPLLTYDLYKDFMDALYIDVEEERLAQFKSIISQLPKANYDTLKYLIMHLIRVQEYESVNLMGTKNLAVVFGPTLMRSLDPSQEFYDTARKNAVVEYLLCCAEDLFEEEYQISPTITFDYPEQYESELVTQEHDLIDLDTDYGDNTKIYT